MSGRAIAWALFLLLLTVARPASADPAADRQALIQALDDLVARTALGSARVGLQVVRLDDGQLLYSHNADDLLNPASNVKLFTTAAALARLGTGFRFETEFLVDRQPDQRRTNPPRFKSGDIKGPLYVRGNADPSITTERLWSMVNDLWFAGLRSVSGDLVLDDTWFDEERVGPGFDQERSDKSYMAPVSALSLESNVVAVHVSSGESVGSKANVEVHPDSPFFVIENRTQTSPEYGLRRLFVTSLPMGEKQRIVVSGRIPLASSPTTMWRKIDHPTFFFGNTLKALLEARGIKIKGRIKRAAAPKDAVPYLLHQSETLDQILKRANKSSSNFVAETLLKTLGAQAGGAPGTWSAGISEVEDFLARDVGIPLGTFVMKNGSGLNDTNRFSAAQVCRLLRFMWQRFQLAPEFLGSLAIAGRDGTISTRMEGTDAAGRLRAKTGTLENVSALSGYVLSVGGEKLVFSLMVNDFTGRLGPVIYGVDAVGIAIAGYGHPGAPGQAYAQVFGPTRVAGPIEELKARVATYDSLARKRDPRNLAFLRTALRSERDPAVRVVIAEAIERTEPESSAGARLLLENFEAGPEVLGRLRQVGREAGTATPVLGSLLRLAGEGNADALARLVEVAAQARDDEGLRGELVDPVAEIARNAPDELIVAMRGASEPSAQAALDLLAKSLSKVVGEHPFAAAVKRAEAATDPQLAVFARSVGEGLELRLAAEKAAKEGQPSVATPDGGPGALLPPAPAPSLHHQAGRP
ncbi:MAG: D-alanyl-D-alanine carboxypeptidase/D-alanyl-D-alanine-endopeptidase [Deltaproteobacteria bacterium]|nr:D-alanyl-D-alanine carboxypeptidase/D-alanyl-D-alanine-endopeptidase [Deltaproteobacteria bacterium]